MGGFEDFLPGESEPSVRDHSGKARILMVILESGHLTVSDGQFFWGGNLNKSWGIALVIKLLNLAICWNICIRIIVTCYKTSVTPYKYYEL